VGIITKERLYRITEKAADEENSPVPLASVIHHRSDVYSLDSIGGTFFSFFFGVHNCADVASGGLGLLVSIMILQNLFVGAFGDHTYAGIPK
jgi:divalent metal cation (Fe/Co/Zn/Cd) transporter